MKYKSLLSFSSIVCVLCVSHSLSAQKDSLRYNKILKLSASTYFVNSTIERKIDINPFNDFILVQDKAKEVLSRLSPSITFITKNKNLFNFGVDLAFERDKQYKSVDSLQRSKNLLWHTFSNKNEGFEKRASTRNTSARLFIRSSYGFNFFKKSKSIFLTVGPSVLWKLYYRKNGTPLNGSKFDWVRENVVTNSNRKSVGLDLELDAKLGFNIGKHGFIEVSVPYKLLYLDYDNKPISLDGYSYPIDISKKLVVHNYLGSALVNIFIVQISAGLRFK